MRLLKYLQPQREREREREFGNQAEASQRPVTDDPVGAVEIVIRASSNREFRIGKFRLIAHDFSVLISDVAGTKFESRRSKKTLKAELLRRTSQTKHELLTVRDQRFALGALRIRFAGNASDAL